jgi:hypothetical protein
LYGGISFSAAQTIVFMEIFVVLEDKTIQDVDEYFTQQETHIIHINASLDALSGSTTDLSLIEKPYTSL